MATYLYDDALVKKLKHWTASTPILIFNPSESKRLFEVIADLTEDKPIKLPIICLNRNDGYTIKEITKLPLSYDAAVLSLSYLRTETIMAIPIRLNYRIDVYTRYYKEADDYIRNFVFNIINFPKLDVVLPYEGQEELIHLSTIKLSETVEDNSGIPERLILGLFTRLSLSIEIPDAYLWDVRFRDNAYIADVSVRTDDPQNI